MLAIIASVKLRAMLAVSADMKSVLYFAAVKNS